MEPEGKQVEDNIVLRIPGRELPYLLFIFVFVEDEAIVLDVLHNLKHDEPCSSNQKDKAHFCPSQSRIIELPYRKEVKRSNVAGIQGHAAHEDHLAVFKREFMSCIDNSQHVEVKVQVFPTGNRVFGCSDMLMMAVDVLDRVNAKHENAHVHVCHYLAYEFLLVEQLVCRVDRCGEEKSKGLSAEQDV